MARWTKKAALERMAGNRELAEVYKRYPLAKLLIDSAAHFRRYPSYHRIACYYAYKDWMGAVTRVDSEPFWICVKVIDDLLPPDDSDLCKEDGSAIPSYNPPLPGLPPRPDRAALYEANGERKMFYTFSELKPLCALEKQRHLGMRDILANLESNKHANSIKTV